LGRGVSLCMQDVYSLNALVSASAGDGEGAGPLVEAVARALHRHPSLAPNQNTCLALIQASPLGHFLSQQSTTFLYGHRLSRPDRTTLLGER
jgi:hypothetical protein